MPRQSNAGDNKIANIPPEKRQRGRPKGVPNKTGALLKDALMVAAGEAGGGGDEGLVAYLTARAKDTPGPFLGLLGKVLPLQVNGKIGGKAVIQVITGVPRGSG